MTPLRYQLASWPEEEHLLAELLAGDEYVGDVRDVDGSLVVTLRRSDAVPSEFDLADPEALLALIGAAMRPDGTAPD